MRRDEHLNYVCATCGNSEFPHTRRHPFVPEVYEAPLTTADVFVDPVLTKISLDCVTMKLEAPRPDWDTFFIGLAEYYSQRSKDPSTKVGAVIVDNNHRVVALGYNGFPRGIEDSEERLRDRDVKYEYMVHGEINAILNASGSVRGCTLYTFPFAPCAGCAPLVIQAGIRRVVTLPVTGELNDRWGESHKLAMRMFREADVEVTYL